MKRAEMLGGLHKRLLIAGAGVAVVGLFILLLLARGGDARTSPDRAAALGEARQASLTLDLPKAVNDRIYGGPLARGRPIVVLDPGHGGRDPGAESVSGQVQEKDLTLTFARELRDVLVKRGRVRIALTREDDRYLTLEERAAVARRLNAAMFLSLHMDSAPNPLARGASVYSLSDVASDAEAARFAAAQNRDSPLNAPSRGVEAMLADLAARDQMSASADLAVRLVRKAGGSFVLRPNPHRFAAFLVLRHADTPAVLFEAGYISNADDEVLLRSPQHRAKMALALAQAIEADVAASSRH